MKRIVLSAALALVGLSACQNELYTDPLKEHKSKQGLYVASNEVIQSFVAEGTEVTLEDLRLALVKPQAAEVKAQIVFGDEQQLQAYNKANGTDYILLPAEMYEAASSLSFEPLATNKVLPIKLKNIKFSPKGTYALPVRLVAEGLDVVPSEEDALIVLEPLTITKVFRFSGSGTEKTFDTSIKVDQWTLEFMINRTNYNSNNRAIGGTKTSDNPLSEIYPRFGDVTIKTNQFQVKTGGSQIDVPLSKLAAKAGEWYMISLVYDGKLTYVYVNGVLLETAEIRTGAYDVGGFWIGGANELIREYRFYKTARTASQIAGNVWKTVDPTDPNLVVYYPLNGKKYDHETGTVTEDATMIWDWSKTALHLNLPAGISLDDNAGQLYTFPLNK